MFECASFESRKFQLDEGDLIVYSDGLTDAENPQEEMFGEERLLEIIQREAPAGSRAVEQTILKRIADFTQSTPQTDDNTFMLVESRFRDNAEETRPGAESVLVYVYPRQRRPTT